MLADNRGIAGGGPRWAEAFAAAGLIHRVRVVDADGDSTVASVVSEAESLRAATILAVGAGFPLAVGMSAAGRLRLPLVHVGS